MPAVAAAATTLRQPGAARWAFVVMPLYYLGIASAYPLITPMLIDAGWRASTPCSHANGA